MAEAARRIAIDKLSEHNLAPAGHIKGKIVMQYALRSGHQRQELRLLIRDNSARPGMSDITVLLRDAYACLLSFLEPGDDLILDKFELKDRSDDGTLSIIVSDRIGSSVTVINPSLSPSHSFLSPASLENFVSPKRLTAASEPPAKRPKKTAYSYVALDECSQRIGAVVNVYGVVTFFRPPTVSRKDPYCQVSLIDSSWTLDEDGLKCMMFAKSMSMLPQNAGVGDIVRLHRVKIQSYNNKPQAITQSGFSCTIFSGRIGAELQPLFSTSANPSFSDVDERMIKALRSWTSAPPSSSVSVSTAATSDTQLCRMVHGTQAEVIAQVVAKEEACYDVEELATGDIVRKPKRNFRLLTIWDGSSPTGSGMPAAAATPEWADDRVLERCINVQLWGKFAAFADAVEAGDFVCLRVGLRQTSTGTWYNVSESSGRVEKLSDTNPSVVQLKQRLDDVLRLKASNRSEQASSASSTQSTSATGDGSDQTDFAVCSQCDQASLETSTVSTILENTACAKLHRCVVQVKAIRPSNVAEATFIYCTKCRQSVGKASLGIKEDTVQCPTCNGTFAKETLRWCYKLALVVADDTGELDAILFDEDAEFFFSDLPATNLYQDTFACNQLEKVFKALMHDRVRLELMLRSYTTKNKDTRFRIHATILRRDRFPHTAV